MEWKRIMSTVVTARIARADSGAFRYQRHRPEKTLLYQLVLKHYPDFRRQLAEEGRVRLTTCSGNSRTTQSVAGLNTEFCGYDARLAARNAWSLSVASAAVSAPVAVRAA